MGDSSSDDGVGTKGVERETVTYGPPVNQTIERKISNDPDVLVGNALKALRGYGPLQDVAKLLRSGPQNQQLLDRLADLFEIEWGAASDDGVRLALVSENNNLINWYTRLKDHSVRTRVGFQWVKGESEGKYPKGIIHDIKEDLGYSQKTAYAHRPTKDKPFSM